MSTSTDLVQAALARAASLSQRVSGMDADDGEQGSVPKIVLKICEVYALVMEYACMSMRTKVHWKICPETRP